VSAEQTMANKQPKHRFPAKYPDTEGIACKTVRVSVPEYLQAEIEAIALELHRERMSDKPKNPQGQGT